MIREDWAFAIEADRLCLAVVEAIEDGDEEAFTALWKFQRSADEWRTIAEEAVALVWETLASWGQAIEEHSGGCTRSEFVHVVVQMQRQRATEWELADQHPWSLLKILRNNQKSKAEGS